ncbi:hypothetical protein [Cryobacterium sp. Sr3]|nr:hypothetical protein [Cryobacterium sp. Sr3]
MDTLVCSHAAYVGIWCSDKRLVKSGLFQGVGQGIEGRKRPVEDAAHLST